MEVWIDHGIGAAHLAIALFNAFGWAFPRRRRAHLFSLALTGLGALATGGAGCPLTLWQRGYRESHGLPAPGGSFLGQLTGWPEAVVAPLGILVFLAALVMNLRTWRTPMSPARPA